MGAFETLVKTMLEMNVFQLFFPWLMVLAVTYGILDKFEIFEEDAVNGTVAIAVAFMSIGGIFLFVPQGLFANFAAAIAFGVFGLLGLVILLALAGIDVSEFDDPQDELPAIMAVVIVIVGFIGVLWAQLDLEKWIEMAGGKFDEVVMPVLILIFLLLVIAVVSEGGGDEE